MNGDTSRGEKLFLSVSQGDNFKKYIQEIRTEFKVLDGGFLSSKDVSTWYADNHSALDTDMRWNQFIEKVDSLLRRCALPLNIWWRNRIITFIVSNDKVVFLPKLHPWQKPFVELSTHHVSRDGSYNDIRIYERATQEDVRELVERTWKYIKPSHRSGTKLKIRKQDSKDLAINEEAVRMMKMSKKDLGITGTVKEITIGRRLSEKYGKKISSDAVKARAHRTRNKKG